MKWLLIVSTIVLCSCQEQADVQPVGEDPYLDAPLHLSHDIKVVFLDSGDTRAELDAGVAMMYEDRKETILGQGMRVIFYNRTTGLQAAVLTADSAVIDDRTKDMTAIGNVVVKSDSNQTTLETSRLVWDQTTEKIRTNEYVVITSPTEVLEGHGLISDQYLTSYRIFNVKGIHRP